MTITYKINAPLTAAELAAVFTSSGINRPVMDLDRLQRMIENADILVSAWDGEQPVGIARAITDYVFCSYLSDLAVRSEYQKQGIGKELINVLRGHLGEEAMLLLLAAPSAMEYYPQLGFEKLVNAFLISRSK
ncbi:GNAT family N-acetyltransferase [Paenibacillus sp. 19GGS1-52]|uniref:GNAT family N-acetyltransferase n=1 Tax=Paenibacillus sp. 19GGS1-52 TaxID=2758563 RepID=UPI001EFB94E6|nr:GNAT family N-acetyltransferase [Paenibacillus sp. 19GGS1-52]ULO05776.1 GNAT family N-acetyltransferase [Paenibacillus sp. 19GGS1-52]